MCLFSVSAVVLGLHPGHADKPGQHDAGPHPLYAPDVRRHGTRRHGDGCQRAGGLPAEEGQGASADALCRRLQTPQIQLMEEEEHESKTRRRNCCIHVLWENAVDREYSCFLQEFGDKYEKLKDILQFQGNPPEFTPQSNWIFL